jgi:hypothetical protein
MATLRLDFFEWGSSQQDGLYMLMVPIVLLPTILVSSLVKYFVTRKLPIESTYKWSFMGSMVSSIICTLLAVADLLWLALVIALMTMLVEVVEIIILSRQFLIKKADIKT